MKKINLALASAAAGLLMFGNVVLAVADGDDVPTTPPTPGGRPDAPAAVDHVGKYSPARDNIPQELPANPSGRPDAPAAVDHVGKYSPARDNIPQELPANS